MPISLLLKINFKILITNQSLIFFNKVSELNAGPNPETEPTNGVDVNLAIMPKIRIGLIVTA